MVGYKVVSLKSDERGRVSVDEIKAAIGPDTAVCMMTNPNTLGLFEDHIKEIADAVHAAGGLMYYDGANANALMGNSPPGRHGLRPHAPQPAQDVLDSARRRRRGRRPGRRCRTSGALFCPTPVVRADGSDDTDGREPSASKTFALDFDRPDAIGSMRSFWSNFAHMVRALAYCLRQRIRGPDPSLEAGGAQRQLYPGVDQGRDRYPVRRELQARIRRVGPAAQARDRRARPRSSAKRSWTAATTRQPCTFRCSSPSVS